MGLFGRKKEQSSQPGSGKLVGFLSDADDAYMLAFEARNIKPFAQYADPAVCTAILQEILSGEDRFFGVAKLRQREWKVTLDDGRTVQAIKLVSHKPVKVGRGVSIPLGDTIKQVWDVRVDGKNKFKVIRVGRPQLDEYC